MDWLSIGKNLAAGQRIRVTCCGTDKTMVIAKTTKTIWHYCHRCKSTRSIMLGQRTLAQITADRKALQDLKHTPHHKKLPALSAIPPDAAVWYLKYGIPHEVMRKYGVGFSKKYNRVCIPLAKGEGMQMRAVYPDQEPKYLNVELKPNAYSSLVFDTGHKVGDKSIVYVTEDVLSAIKIRLAGYRAIAIIGTNVRKKIHHLMPFQKIVAWFDADASGRSCDKDLNTLCELIGKPFRSIYTPKDPKVYSREEIREIIDGNSRR